MLLLALIVACACAQAPIKDGYLFIAVPNVNGMSLHS